MQILNLRVDKNRNVVPSTLKIANKYEDNTITLKFNIKDLTIKDYEYRYLYYDIAGTKYYHRLSRDNMVKITTDFTKLHGSIPCIIIISDEDVIDKDLAVDTGDEIFISNQFSLYIDDDMLSNTPIPPVENPLTVYPLALTFDTNMEDEERYIVYNYNDGDVYFEGEGIENFTIRDLGGYFGITQNNAPVGTYNFTVSDSATVKHITITVESNFSLVNLEASSSKSEQTFTPTDAYGYGEVVISGYELNNQDKEITATKETQVVEPDAGYDGLDSVTVNGYTPVTQEKSVNPGKIAQEVLPDEGVDGLSKVTVNPYVADTQEKEVTATKETIEVEPDDGKDGLSKVTINPYEMQMQEKAVNPSKRVQVITPDLGKDGLSKVTVNPMAVHNQEKSARPTAYQQVIEADSGYDGLESVTIAPMALQEKTVSASKEEQEVVPDVNKDGLSKVTIEGYVLDNQEKTVHPSTSEQEIEPDEGKDGLSKVTVEAMDLQQKTITGSKVQQVVEPDNDKDGLSRVIVNGYTPVTQEKTITATKSQQVVEPDEGKDGLSRVTVDGYTPVVQEKTITATKSTQEVVPDSGKDGLSKVTVEGYTVSNQNKNASPSQSQQVIEPDNGYDGLGSVTIAPMVLQNKTVHPSTSEQIIYPDANKDGLGQVTVEAVELQEKTVNPSHQSQEIVADSGKDGLSKVTVNPYSPVNQQKTVHPSTSQQQVTPDGAYDGLSQVTVEAMNLQSKSVTPGNVQQTVTPDVGYDGLSQVIVGAGGGGSPVLQNKTVIPTTQLQQVQADYGYDGLGVVSVDGVDASIDANIQAGNIKKNVTILGVTGTMEGHPGILQDSLYMLCSGKSRRDIEKLLTMVGNAYNFQSFMYQIGADGFSAENTLSIDLSHFVISGEKDSKCLYQAFGVAASPIGGFGNYYINNVKLAIGTIYTNDNNGKFDLTRMFKDIGNYIRYTNISHTEGGPGATIDIVFTGATKVPVDNLTYAFYSPGLLNADLSWIDYSGITNSNNISNLFYGSFSTANPNYNLQYVKFNPDIQLFGGIAGNLTVNIGSRVLDLDYLIDNLPVNTLEYTRTIKVYKGVKDAASAATLQKFTDKNYTLTGATS